MSDAVGDYWKFFHASGHFAVLAAYNGPAPLQHLPLSPEDWGRIAWGAVRQNSMGLALRGLWCVGKLGKLALPWLRDHWDGPVSFLTSISTGFSLASIALRHARYRAEILRKIRARAYKSDVPVMAAWVDVTAALVDAAIAHPEEMKASGRLATAGALHEALKAAQAKGVDTPWKFGSPEEIHDDILLPFLLASENAIVTNDTNGLEYLGCTIPWVATSKAEDLYMPAQFTERIKAGFDAKSTFGLIERLRSERTPTQPLPFRKDKPDPGPNASCPCGSGTKYKRCCGRPVVRVAEKIVVPQAVQDSRTLADLPVLESFLMHQDPDLRRRSGETSTGTQAPHARRDPSAAS